MITLKNCEECESAVLLLIILGVRHEVAQHILSLLVLLVNFFSIPGGMVCSLDRFRGSTEAL